MTHADLLHEWAVLDKQFLIQFPDLSKLTVGFGTADGIKCMERVFNGYRSNRCSNAAKVWEAEIWVGKPQPTKAYCLMHSPSRKRERQQARDDANAAQQRAKNAAREAAWRRQEWGRKLEDIARRRHVTVEDVLASLADMPIE